MPAQFTQKEYSEFLSKNFPTLKAVGEYVGSAKNFKHYCTIHKLEFDTSYNSLRHQAYNKRGSMCPECRKERPKKPARNGHVTTRVPVTEAKARLAKAFGSSAPRMLGEYMGVAKKQSFECPACGKHFTSTVSVLVNQYTYPCSCKRLVARIPFASIEKKELDFLKYLYLDMFWTAEQISEITGLKVGTVHNALKRENAHRGQNKTQVLRNMVDRKSGSLDFSAYSTYARIMTRYVYGTYGEIIDPRSVKGREYHVDHGLSLFDGYRKYGTPLSLQTICHPANLRLVTARENLLKNAKSVWTLRELKARIKRFEETYGTVCFPDHLQHEFSANAVVTNTGLRVLAFDPGVSNFGAFGGILYGAKRLQNMKAITSVMLKNSIRSLGEDFEVQRAAFISEIEQLIRKVRPDVLLVERFQTRGLKGTTIEFINVMIGLIGGVLAHMAETGEFNGTMKIITASQWKNALNKKFSLEKLYEQMPQSQRHRLDACLMSIYAFPDKEAYGAVDEMRQTNIVNFILKTRV